MSRKFCLMLVFCCAVLVSAPAAYGQGVKGGPDPSTIRDPDLEKDSLHNLEVARNYFKLKKAYVAALMRLEEIIAGNPNFAKIEEVYLLAGQSSLWLAEGKGKQKPEQYFTFQGGKKHTLTPEQFRMMGRDFLTKLVTDFPNGQYTKQAQEELRGLDESSSNDSKP